MIPDNNPAADLPRYVHPETGAAWFACPKCGGEHVRPRGLAKGWEQLNTTITTANQRLYCVVPGSDRVLDLEYGKGDMGDYSLKWLACGGCGHNFRVDGAPLDLSGVVAVWNVVDDASGPASVGVTLRAELSPLVDRALQPLRLAPLGEGVGLCLDSLWFIDGYWMDEPASDGTSGLHIHPANLGLGVPAWCVAPFDEDAEWERDALLDEGGKVRIAYDFVVDSLPTIDWDAAEG